MARLTKLAEYLRAGGLEVKEVSGWQSRGRALARVSGGVVHDTATDMTIPGDVPTLGVVTNGRSDLAGPLYNALVSRSGVWHIVASGLANHAGVVSNPDYGNSASIGVSREHSGARSVELPGQYASLVKGLAVLAVRYGIEWRGHGEVASPRGRKVDPGLDMDKLRADIKRAGLPTLPTTPKPPKAGGSHVHTVEPGDTLSALAKRYGTSVKALAKLNGLADPNRIRVGARLWLRWNVKPGQTLSGIAKTMGVTVAAIAKANGIPDPDLIRAGAWLVIP